MQIFEFTRDSSEWLDARSKDVTATEVASLLGMNKYKSANKVLEEKKELPVHVDNKFMKTGRRLEPVVFIRLEELYIPAKAAHPTKVVYVRDEEYNIGASLDGLMNSKEEGQSIVEAKTTRPALYNNWKTTPPESYIIQTQTQMMVKGIKHALLVCMTWKAIPTGTFDEEGMEYFDVDYPVCIWEIRADTRLHKIIRQQVSYFWECFNTGSKYKVKAEVKDEVKKIIYDNCQLYHFEEL